MRIDFYLDKFIRVDVDGVRQRGVKEVTPIPPKYQVETKEGALLSVEVPKVVIEDGVLRVEE